MTAAPKPQGLSPPKHFHAHEDSTHQSMRQLSECSRNSTAPSDRPSTLQPPASLTQQQLCMSTRLPVSNMYGEAEINKSDSDIQSPVSSPPICQTPMRRPAYTSPTSLPHNHVVRRYSSMPNRTEPPSSLTALQRLHTRLTTMSYPDSPRLTLAQQHRWFCPVTALRQRSVGLLRSLAPSTLRLQQGSDDEFREVELHDPVSSEESSDDECVDRSRLPPHQRRLKRTSEQQQAQPRPRHIQQHYRVRGGIGLEGCTTISLLRSTTLKGVPRGIRGSDNSVSSSSCGSESDISLKRTSPPCPEVPAGMEVPDDPNIVARPHTRGGVAFEYLLVPDAAGGRPNTPMVPRPVSRRNMRRTRCKTLTELELQQRLAELRRKVSSIRLPPLAQACDCNDQCSLSDSVHLSLQQQLLEGPREESEKDEGRHGQVYVFSVGERQTGTAEEGKGDTYPACNFDLTTLSWPINGLRACLPCWAWKRGYCMTHSSSSQLLQQFLPKVAVCVSI